MQQTTSSSYSSAYHFWLSCNFSFLSYPFKEHIAIQFSDGVWKEVQYGENTTVLLTFCFWPFYEATTLTLQFTSITESLRGYTKDQFDYLQTIILAAFSVLRTSILIVNMYLVALGMQRKHILVCSSSLCTTAA